MLDDAEWFREVSRMLDDSLIELVDVPVTLT